MPMKLKENLQRQRHHLDRQFTSRRDDSYHPEAKPKGVAVCNECHAVYRRGRWRNEDAPADAQQVVCPACQRIRDGFAAGHVTLSGEFLSRHHDEILALVQNEERHEHARHPMERIMAIDDKPGATSITTTGVHIARRIGEALQRAHHGSLDIQYGPDETSVRVQWVGP
jgi:hypothetical protein